MRVGQFSVTIPEGQEQSSGHVHLPNGQQYRIRLNNHFPDRRCDATVRVDGKEVGTFRLERIGGMLLERPAHDTGKFTFYGIRSDEAKVAGVDGVAREARGLVEVTFRPERQAAPLREYLKSASISHATPRCGHISVTSHSVGQGEVRPVSLQTGQEKSVGAGITGLSGHSLQEFHDVPNLTYDPVEEVQITLRLVEVTQDGPRPLTSVPRSNPVPAAVG